MPPSDQKLYTIHLRGGNPFEAQLEGNPSIKHSGGTSVHHLVITEEEAKMIRGLALVNRVNCIVREMPGQTEQQARERAGFQVRPGDPPHPQCGTCPWYDPSERSQCGVLDWAPESVQTLMEKDQRFVEARGKCPLSR